MSELLEWSPLRLFIEGVAGAVGGAMVASLLPEAEARMPLFVTIGALAAPAALLLTPSRGALPYRATRFGIALAVLVTLAASFVAGADGLRIEELAGLGILAFALGALWHGAATRLPWSRPDDVAG